MDRREAMRWQSSAGIFDALLVVGALCAMALLGFAFWSDGWPGDQSGYVPDQPIAFSHRQHVAELEIGCRYCHGGAVSRAAAGMPSVADCMSCHRFVLAASQAVKDEQWAAAREGRPVGRVISAEIQKVLRASGLDEHLQPVPGLLPEPIPWIRVVRIPDFVFFSHAAHNRVGVGCAECHGPVETFDRMHVDRSLTMGFCVDCHRRTTRTGIDGRQVDASIDCIACHR